MDTFHLISSSYGTDEWDEIKLLRKNRRISPECDFLTGGVDLNRNYGYKFGYDDIGSQSNPCGEMYRGTKPFSEPETQAMRNLTDVFQSSLVSAMNFHAYGDLWISPFNFEEKPGSELLAKTNYKLYKAYDEFNTNAPHPKGSK